VCAHSQWFTHKRAHTGYTHKGTHIRTHTGPCKDTERRQSSCEAISILPPLAHHHLHSLLLPQQEWFWKLLMATLVDGICMAPLLTLCVCVCVCVCVNVCVYVYVYVIYKCICIYIYIYTHTHIYIYIYIRIYIIYVCMCVCVYIYIDIYRIHTHTHTHKETMETRKVLPDPSIKSSTLVISVRSRSRSTHTCR
jgi:hypothetical protein